MRQPYLHKSSIARQLMKLEISKLITRAEVGVTAVGYDDVGVVVVVRQLMVVAVVDAVRPSMVVLALRHDVVVGVVGTRSAQAPFESISPQSGLESLGSMIESL